MRLKHIKLVGFKSFVDATTVPFPEQMTAIVGPNGCGKSNVIDAVRWVLGESSAKNLRGDAMTDVIFNGSTNRKPVSQASVELVFDNTEGRLQGQLADRNEISVKRLVTKDAVSSYFLNGTKCRRRDITDIFLGTGLGPRSYAIIEQGMISRLIESKPQELRIFLEEAAGISKYKERRRETENRIKHTRENLERLADVREELGTQLEKLKRQAATARRYKQLKQQERQYKAELHALKWHEYNEQLNFHEQQRLIKETELESFMAEQRGGELGLIKLKEQLNNLNDKAQETQQKVFQTSNTITKLEQQIVFDQERASQREDQKTQLISAIKDADELLEHERENLETLELQLEELEPQQMLATEQYEQVQAELLAAEESYERQQNSIAQQLKNLSQAQQNVKVIETRVHHAQIELARNQQRQRDLSQELQDLSIHEHQEEIELHKEKLTELTDTVTDLQSQIQQWQQTATELTAQLEQSKQAVKASERALHETTIHLEQLQNWQIEFEQTQNQQTQIEVLGPAISALDVEPKWLAAVEYMMQQHGQPLLVNKLPSEAHHQAHDGQYLLSGKQADSQSGSLASVISDGVFPAWFNLIGLADNQQHAQTLLSQGWHFAVTTDGTWFGQNWQGRGNFEQSGNQSVLQKRQEIEKLSALQQSQSDELADLMTQQTTLEAKLRDANASLKELESKFAESQKQQHSCELEIRLLEQQASSVLQQKNKISQELNELSQGIEESELSIEMLQEELLMAQESELELQQDSEQTEEGKAEAQRRLQNAKSQAEQINRERQQVELQVQDIKSKIANLTANLQRAEAHRAQTEQKLTQLLDQGQELQTAELLQEQLEEQLQLRLELEELLLEQNKAVADVAEQIKTLEQGQSGVMAKLDKMRDAIADVKMESEGVRVRAQNMIEVLAQMNVNLKELLENMPSEAEKEAWSEALEKTTHSIQRLGAINLAAIEEYDIQAERKGYLDEQFEDLTSALETLEAAIRKIDRESRAKFKETYEQVNEGLQTLFPKVFGGGAAYLELTDDDLLETGVTIMARPPGKKNSTIHLLSGGEKALTALSLVFSIFKLNPAPFCMLDEVDAPLDDANVGRFCKLVSEMSDSVQFIYISHNKVAMEMATHLTGVTMQEPGVSRLVAVDIQQAVEMAEAV